MTSGTYYLERKNILMRQRHRPKHWYGASKSHRRPVVVLPELLGPDSPADRVITLPDEERRAYEREGCGEACQD